MIQKTEVRLIIHLLKYLKNNADLEAKAHFCIISLKIFRINCLFMILLQKEWNKIEVDFEKWLLSDISLSFQNIRKKNSR
jgi:hypothetical protein